MRIKEKIHHVLKSLKKKIKKVIYSFDDYDVRVINRAKYDLKKNKVTISKISINNPCFNEIKNYNYSKKWITIYNCKISY